MESPSLIILCWLTTSKKEDCQRGDNTEESHSTKGPTYDSTEVRFTASPRSDKVLFM